jgi:hypothetical protein
VLARQAEELLFIYWMHTSLSLSKLRRLKYVHVSHCNYPHFSLGFGINAKMFKIRAPQSTGQILAQLKEEGYKKKCFFYCSNLLILLGEMKNCPSSGRNFDSKDDDIYRNNFQFIIPLWARGGALG